MARAFGFTDEQIQTLYEVERWSLDEQRELVRDAARPGGFNRIYHFYLEAGRTPDRERYMMYLADGARQLDMRAEALAILRQATNSELKTMDYRGEAPLRELIAQVQKERRGRFRRGVAVGVAVGAVGTAALTGLWLYFRSRERNVSSSSMLD